MRVLVAWHGETSKQIASVLEDWMPRFIPNTKIFRSTQLPPGVFWVPHLAKEIEKSDAGILLLPPESLQNGWIMFEAGALLMGVRGRPAYGLLFNVETADVPSPLNQLQLSPFSRDEFFKVIRDLHRRSGDKLIDKAEARFQRCWPEFEQALQPSIARIKPRSKPTSFACEAMANRTELYDRISGILEGKKEGWVHDTTWGKDPPEQPNRKEQQALDRYRKSRFEAVKNGVAYKELFSFSIGRLERIREALAETIKDPLYDARVFEKSIDFSIPDFFVTDAGELIISHVDATPQGGKPKYLYINCTDVADFYHDWFEECWKLSTDPAKAVK